MPTSSETVLQLRQLLAERFGAPTGHGEEVYLTGLASLDEAGVTRAALTEIVSSPVVGGGGSLLLYGLLHACAERNERVMVIDGRDCFQPQALPQSDLQRLLWVRCHSAREVLQSVDMAARDGSFPLILVLLTLNPHSELRRIPANAWHRVQMLADKSASTVMVFTPFPHIGCARLRLSVGGDFPLSKLHRCRSELISGLALNIERRRIERRVDETLCRSSCA